VIKIQKITLNKEECIGCGACTAVLDEFFEMDDDRKATIKGGKKKGNIVEKEVSEKDLKKLKEVLDVCPAGSIKIEK